MLNHGDLDVLIHPNSGCEMYDHLLWPMWIGNKWELQTRCFHMNAPGFDIYDCRNAAPNIMFHKQYNSFVCFCFLSSLFFFVTLFFFLLLAVCMFALCFFYCGKQLNTKKQKVYAIYR